MRLVADRLVRTYGPRRIFGPLSFRVEPGTVFGVSGQNGSGKTTLVKVLTGLVRPSSGGVFLEPANGGGPRTTPRDGTGRLGWCAPDLALYGELTPAENLEFFARVAGRPVAAPEADRRLAEVGLDPVRGRTVRTRFLSTGQRLGQLKETVSLLKRMWGDEAEVSFEGKYVHATKVVCEPKPARSVPILIGGAGEQVTLKLAAREADIWNNLAAHHAALPHKIDVFKQHCREAGRPLNEVVISQQCLVTIAPDEASAGPMVETAKKIFGGHMGDPTGPLAISGSPQRVREQIQKHMDLGCTMFVMEFFGRDTREPAKLFAETVLPHFK